MHEEEEVTQDVDGDYDVGDSGAIIEKNDLECLSAHVRNTNRYVSDPRMR